MLKFTCSIFFVCVVGFGGGSVLSPSLPLPYQRHLARSNSDLASQWGPHIMDFLELIDMGKIITVALQYIDDPEVKDFIKFITSEEFALLIEEIESLEEFIEAIEFLESKGYRAEYIINAINAYLNIPPIETRVRFVNKQGMAGFIEDIIMVLPREEIKELFISKLENSPEVAQLFETVNSEEFINIMKRMSQNPKFKGIMFVLETYGFQADYFCALVKEIFGDFYQGIFCE